MTAANTTDRRLFDVTSAADYLKTLGADAATTNFVRTLLTSGQVPFEKIGKKFYVRRQDLDAWIENHARRRR